MIVLSGCGQVDAAGVDSQRARLESTAAEGGLVADGTAQGRLASPYVAAQAAQLADDASDIASSLTDASVAADARPRAGRVRAVARRVADAMGRLSARPDDRAVAADVSRRLAAAGRELRAG